MPSYGTITLLELVWTLAAVPGFYTWSKNRLVAGQNLKAAKLANAQNGRMLWARFSVQLTTCFVMVEVLKLGVGFIAMGQPNATQNPSVLGWAVTAMLLGSSVIISYMGYKWLAVDNEIIRLVLKRQNPPSST